MLRLICYLAMAIANLLSAEETGVEGSEGEKMTEYKVVPEKGIKANADQYRDYWCCRDQRTKSNQDEY
ncbi:hypothetical protein [Robertkochia flava]|uniref:hypothetical protein n=1 Tax=Robertkochia flava TaxID=3447986 RepID=UPI001CCA2F55|nr:hypothetical protein [Robertkochia marina]